MQTITPFLWFDAQAEEAIIFYVSVFSGAPGGSGKLISLTKYPDAVPGMGGKVLTAVFELNGQQLMALDGGSQYKFTEAISLHVDCANQEEVDYYWEKLTEGGGSEVQCGWLKDKYGLCWQIIPKDLGRLMSDPDPVKANNVMQAMLKMKKIVIADLEKAAQ